jgi:energy-coupling factor transporter ATP-binding protein EcfA2
MLLSFRFANHRSFRDEQQLLLTPVYAADHGDAELEEQALRVVGIFGANASGKSNVLNALAFMRRLAIRSDRDVEPGLGMSKHPYRLDERARSEPSRYVVDLRLKGVRHTYGFSISYERVLEEWLYYFPQNRKNVVFERTDNDFKWTVKSKLRVDLEAVSAITAPNALFLSTIARFDQRRRASSDTRDDPLHDVYRWFLRVIGPRSKRDGFEPSRLWPDNPSDREVVAELIRAADLGITDVELKSSQPDALFGTDLFGGELEESADTAVARRRARELVARATRDVTNLQFSHRGPGGSVKLDWVDESAGTTQLLALAIDAAAVLRLAPATMIVDEIDASLHPMLTARLIQLFHSPLTNRLGSQLLFSTHDASLLGTFDAQEVLHRDQIWFTSKDEEGCSSLYPLSEFKPRREGENRQKRYLNGAYGGVPDLAWDVFEQALLARGELDASADA